MRRLFLLNALPLMLLSGCSIARPGAPMPLPPANLAQSCQSLPPLPRPLIDPDRGQWETDVVQIYADCAGRHWSAIDAWKAAVAEANK